MVAVGSVEGAVGEGVRRTGGASGAGGAGTAQRRPRPGRAPQSPTPTMSTDRTPPRRQPAATARGGACNCSGRGMGDSAEPWRRTLQLDGSIRAQPEAPVSSAPSTDTDRRGFFARHFITNRFEARAVAHLGSGRRGELGAGSDTEPSSSARLRSTFRKTAGRPASTSREHHAEASTVPGPRVGTA